MTMETAQEVLRGSFIAQVAVMDARKALYKARRDLREAEARFNQRLKIQQKAFRVLHEAKALSSVIAI